MRTHLSIGISLEGSMEGLREDAPDCLLEREPAESSADGRRTKWGLPSSEGRRDMVVVVRGQDGGSWGRDVGDAGDEDGGVDGCGR